MVFRIHTCLRVEAWSVNFCSFRGEGVLRRSITNCVSRLGKCEEERF